MTEPVFIWLAADLGLAALDVASIFSGWEIHYHEERGERAAAALLKGPEVHFVAAPAWRRKLIRRGNTRAFFGALFEKSGGMLTTRILHGASGAAEFVRRIGFEKTWSDDVFDYYALCALPFQRGNP